MQISPTNSKESYQNGTVLIIVVGIISAMAILGILLIVITNSKAKETQTFRNIENARIAAFSALNYAVTAMEQILVDNKEWESSSCGSVADAVTQFNEHLFNESSSSSPFYYLKDRNDFPHDAFDLSQDSNAILGSYSFPETGVCEEKDLEPTGAVYTCEYPSTQFIPGAFEDVEAVNEEELPTVNFDKDSEGVKVSFKLYGWGRVFERSGTSYIPICEDACYTAVTIRIMSVVVVDSDDEGMKRYRFELSGAKGTTMTPVTRIEIGQEGIWPSFDWTGNTWFLNK